MTDAPVVPEQTVSTEDETVEDEETTRSSGSTQIIG